MLVVVDQAENQVYFIVIMVRKMVCNHLQSFVRKTFIVFGMAVTVWNVNYNLQIYLKHGTKTEMTIETNDRTAWPSLTICLNSLHSKSEF